MVTGLHCYRERMLPALVLSVSVPGMNLPNVYGTWVRGVGENALRERGAVPPAWGGQKPQVRSASQLTYTGTTGSKEPQELGLRVCSTHSPQDRRWEACAKCTPPPKTVRSPGEAVKMPQPSPVVATTAGTCTKPAGFCFVPPPGQVPCDRGSLTCRACGHRSHGGGPSLPPMERRKRTAPKRGVF